MFLIKTAWENSEHHHVVDFGLFNQDYVNLVEFWVGEQVLYQLLTLKQLNLPCSKPWRRKSYGYKT